MRWRGRALAKKMGLGQQRRRRNSSLGSNAQEAGGKRFARIGADPFHHGAQAVGTLRRQMLAKSELVEDGEGVGTPEYAAACGWNKASAGSRPVRARYGRRCRRDSSAMVRRRCGRSAWKARPGSTQSWHLVRRGVLGFRHRFQRAAEFDDVPVVVVPLIQQRKIIPDFVDRHCVSRSIPTPYIGS